MNTALSYSLMRYQPDASRHEVVNIGAILFTPEGPTMALASNMGKLLALNPNASVSQVYEQAQSLHATAQRMQEKGLSPEQTVGMLSRAMAGAVLMPLGSVATQGRAPSEVLSELMAALVTPPTRQRAAKPRSHSRLHAEITTLFKQAKMLGTEPGDIAEHLVVPRFPIDADVGLFAEFALRNGRLHITETVDFRVKDQPGKKREAEAKTLVLIQALETVGRQDLQRYVVVSGASAETQSSINLLSRYTDHMVVREDQASWIKYINTMARAADKPEICEA